MCARAIDSKSTRLHAIVAEKNGALQDRCVNDSQYIQDEVVDPTLANRKTRGC